MECTVIMTEYHATCMPRASEAAVQTTTAPHLLQLCAFECVEDADDSALDAGSGKAPPVGGECEARRRRLMGVHPRGPLHAQQLHADLQMTGNVP